MHNAITDTLGSQIRAQVKDKVCLELSKITRSFNKVSNCLLVDNLKNKTYTTWQLCFNLNLKSKSTFSQSKTKGKLKQASNKDSVSSLKAREKTFSPQPVRFHQNFFLRVPITPTEVSTLCIGKPPMLQPSPVGSQLQPLSQQIASSAAISQSSSSLTPLHNSVRFTGESCPHISTSRTQTKFLRVLMSFTLHIGNSLHSSSSQPLTPLLHSSPLLPVSLSSSSHTRICFQIKLNHAYGNYRRHFPNH